MAIDFDGSNDLIRVMSSTHPTAMTMGGWVCPDATTSTTSIHFRTDGGEAGAYSHLLGITGATPKFYAYMWDGGAKTVTGTTTVVVGTWYHVMLACTNSSTLKLYVNGVSEGTPASVGTMWTGGDRYCIGKPWSGVYWFNGRMEDYRLYLVELSAAQIALLGNGYRGPIGSESFWLSMRDAMAATGWDQFTLTSGTHTLPNLAGTTQTGDPVGSPVGYASTAPVVPLDYPIMGQDVGGQSWTQAADGAQINTGLLAPFNILKLTAGAQTNTGLVNKFMTLISTSRTLGSQTNTGAVLKQANLPPAGAITFGGILGRLENWVTKTWEVYFWPSISKMVTLMRKGGKR